MELVLMPQYFISNPSWSLPSAWGFAGRLGIKSAEPPAKFQKPYTFTLLQSVFQDSNKSAVS